MNKNEILNELIKAGILSESDAQIVYYNIHQLDKLAKADTPEQKKTLNTLRFELLKIIFAPCYPPPEAPPEQKKAPKPRTPPPTQTEIATHTPHQHTPPPNIKKY
jgi:hypothetical protein